MSGSDGIVLAGFGAFIILPIIFGIAIYVGLAFLCANIAKRKGNSAAGWFVLGLLFGVIALIIICCEPEKTPINKPNNQNANNQNFNNAPNNGFNQNQGVYQNGQGYQQNFNQNQSGIAATDKVAQNIKWRCSNCGYMNDPRARDCVICNQKRAGF